MAKALSNETFLYSYGGEEYTYRVEGDEEGNWSIYCDHTLFKVVNGNHCIYKASSVSEALLKLGNAHSELASAMLAPFGKHCRDTVNAYCHFLRDRRQFYYLN